jgi:hypothetical protein
LVGQSGCPQKMEGIIKGGSCGDELAGTNLAKNCYYDGQGNLGNSRTFNDSSITYKDGMAVVKTRNRILYPKNQVQQCVYVKNIFGLAVSNITNKNIHFCFLKNNFISIINKIKIGNV